MIPMPDKKPEIENRRVQIPKRKCRGDGHIDV